MEKYIECVQYAQYLENENHCIQKEILNLQYLNKFLTMTQKKKDDMISYLFEENRMLKSENMELHKSLEKIKTKKKNPEISLSASNPNNTSRIQGVVLPNIPSNHTLNNAVNTSNTKKFSAFGLMANNENNNPKKKIKVYEDNLAYKTLLNMNLSIIIKLLILF